MVVTTFPPVVTVKDALLHKEPPDSAVAKLNGVALGLTAGLRCPTSEGRAMKSPVTDPNFPGFVRCRTAVDHMWLNRQDGSELSGDSIRESTSILIEVPDPYSSSMFMLRSSSQAPAGCHPRHSGRT